MGGAACRHKDGKIIGSHICTQATTAVLIPTPESPRSVRIHPTPCGREERRPAGSLKKQVPPKTRVKALLRTKGKGLKVGRIEKESSPGLI